MDSKNANKEGMQDLAKATFRTSDNCIIEYSLHVGPGNDAPRLALVHSLANDRRLWNRVVAELSADAQILTYDCRGHGASGAGILTYKLPLFARDLAELLDHVGWRDAVVAGCSMGGCITQAFAALYSNRTTAICLVDTTAWFGRDASRLYRARAATASEKGMGALVEYQSKRWFGDLFRAEHPEIVKPLEQVFLANNVSCYRATCEMLGDADLRSLLPSLKVPTAIVVGSEDKSTPIAMAEAMHEAIPHSTLVVLEGASHLTPVERPQDIAGAILQLL